MLTPDNTSLPVDPPIHLPTPPPHTPAPIIDQVFEDRVELNLATHATAREATYQGTYQWQGRGLNPFSLARRNLFWRLRELDVPVLSWEDEISKRAVFLNSAQRLLWLMHQPEATIRAIRDGSFSLPKVFTAIDLWAEISIPPHLDNAACELTIRILEDVATHSATPAPSPGAPAPLGNAPGPSSPL